MPTRKVDEKYVKHIVDEIATIKKTKPGDRLSSLVSCQNLLGVSANHLKSLLTVLSSEALAAGLLNDLTDEDLAYLVEELVGVAVTILKADKKAVVAIPTITQEATIPVAEHNPLVS